MTNENQFFDDLEKSMKQSVDFAKAGEDICTVALWKDSQIVGYKCHTTNFTKFFGNRTTPTNNSIENLAWIDKK